MTPTGDKTPRVGQKTLMGGYLFGAPVGDLGWFATLLISVGVGFVAFFAATFVGIFGIMVAHANHHATDYADSYKYVGLPFGVLMAVIALAYLGMLWLRRIFRKN